MASVQSALGELPQPGFIWHPRNTATDTFGNPIYRTPVSFSAVLELKELRGTPSSAIRDQIVSGELVQGLVICEPLADSTGHVLPNDQITTPDGSLLNVISVDVITIERGRPHHLEIEVAEDL